MNNPLDLFAWKLRTERKRQHLTQKALAERLHMSVRTIIEIGNPAVGFCEVRMDDPGGPSGIECFQELEDRSLPVIDIFHLPRKS